MKRIYQFLFTICLLSFALSCTTTTTTDLSNQTTGDSFTVQLNGADGTLYQEFSDCSYNETISLPVLEEEGMIFVGWSFGDSVFYNEATITQDMILTATFEAINAVFEYQVFENSRYGESIVITDYRGTAQYLKIPEMIDGYYVSDIGGAFHESDLIEVWIPNSVVRIVSNSFGDSAQLHSVHFYGDYYGEWKVLYTSNIFEALLVEYQDVCSVASYDEILEETTYSDTCPFISSYITGQVTVDDVLYYSYMVTYDPNMYHSVKSISMFDNSAFGNMPALTYIEISANNTLLDPLAFLNSPNLKTIVVDELNEYYKVVDGVLYSDDESEIVYYPSGKTDTLYAIPEGTTTIGAFAFHSNLFLETLSLPQSLAVIGGPIFYNMESIQNIHVDENNDIFYDIDGVLFSTFEYLEGDYLVCYPSARPETTYTIPDNISVIGVKAFLQSTYLEIIVISSSVVYIDSYAFAETKAMEILYIPATVESIGKQITSFSSIQTVFLMRSSTDGELTYIWGQVNDSSLFSTYQNPLIYVPDDSYEAYRTMYINSPLYDYLREVSSYPEE